MDVDAFKAFVTHPATMATWLVAMLACVAVVVHDLRARNAHLMPTMKLVWVLTVLYSGPLGLAVYWTCGRKEIPDDCDWRRAFRSVCHCYSGCGAGEVTGVIIAAGLLALPNWWIAGVTFVLAYVMGYALTVGPMVQSGVALKEAMRDAFVAETPSITVMEITAISIDMWLAGSATINEPLFWSSLVVSLSCGLFVAYPVNWLLIKIGVKEGMMDPRKTEHAHA